MKLAVDYGRKRCGYAIGEMTPAKAGVTDPEGILRIVRDMKPDAVILGLPLSMSGRYSCQTFEVLEFADKLKKMGFDVFLVDERLTTKMAHDILKESRGNTAVDAVSASLIFESFVENPGASYKIPKELPKVEMNEEIRGKKVLILNVPDPSVLDRVEAEELDVLQRDPYFAYLFKKRVRFVERFEEFLKGPYDTVIACSDDFDEDLLEDGGKAVILECPI